ncbi:hypothetical protein B14911_17995 [Bacillus sp. NRRL B-14911]|nr:hypothetical protein B14911_17995 [Bacillus sp. NRRL B-14911]
MKKEEVLMLRHRLIMISYFSSPFPPDLFFGIPFDKNRQVCDGLYEKNKITFLNHKKSFLEWEAGFEKKPPSPTSPKRADLP